MHIVLLLNGMALGALIVATVLVLWNGFRRQTGFSIAAQEVIWFAWFLLLLAVPLAWQDSPGLTLGLRLAIMAVIAMPLRRPSPESNPWNRAIRLYPVLVLTGVALFHFILITQIEDFARSPITALNALIILCAGFSAGALGEALSQLFATRPSKEPPSLYVYAPLTLLVCGTLLINLKQHGSLWIETSYDNELGGVWLAWATAWLCPRNYPRIRALLIVVASVLLILLGAKPI